MWRQTIANPSQRNEKLQPVLHLDTEKINKNIGNLDLSYTLILRRLKILKILTCLEAFQVLRQQLHQQQRGQEPPDDDVYVYDANVCVCMFVRHEK